MTTAFAEIDVDPATRLLAGLDPRRPLGLQAHLARYGRPVLAGDLLKELEASGVRGRGGAGFPVADKVRAVGSRRGRPVIVINAAEGEPLSHKDKLLIGRLPHLVIDGAVALAAAIGAHEVLIAHAESARRGADALTVALEERRRLHDRISVAAVAVPDGYVTGQETALINFLNGGPALPTFTPPRPFESGIGGRPTLVQNAETVAHVAMIARHGAGWYRRVGTAAEPGTALFTLSGAIARPGVYEAALGAPVKALVASAGGLVQPPRAVLVGGYAGTWIDARAASGLTLDDACLASYGATLGVRTVTVLPEGACGVCETARITRYLARESAGQCGPCVHGLAALAGGLERHPDRSRLARHADEVRGRGACRHPDGAARLVASALTVFARELATHDSRSCRAGSRARDPGSRPAMSKSLRVNPIACQGHGLCAELFPERIRLDDWGYPIIEPGPIPPELERHARRAVDACPVLALALVAAERAKAPQSVSRDALGAPAHSIRRSYFRSVRVSCLLADLPFAASKVTLMLALIEPAAASFATPVGVGRRVSTNVPPDFVTIRLL